MGGAGFEVLEAQVLRKCLGSPWTLGRHCTENFHSSPQRQVRLLPRVAQPATRSLGHPSPCFVDRNASPPPPPSPRGVQSVGLGIGLPLSVILICKTTGGDAARIPNVACGLTTLVMHDPHPEFPKSETFSVPAETVPGDMGEGRARIWAEVEAGLLQGLQTPRVSHSVSPLWTRPRDVGAVDRSDHLDQQRPHIDASLREIQREERGGLSVCPGPCWLG